MPTITYRAKIKNSNYTQSIPHNSQSMRFGDRPKSIRPSETIVSGNSDPKKLSDGWRKSPAISDEQGSIDINNEYFCKDNGFVAPTLNGLSVSAINEIRLDSSLYEKAIGSHSVLGVKSIGNGNESKSYIFERSDDKLSIWKEFEYQRTDLLVSKVSEDQYTEIQLDGQNYILFGQSQPAPLSKFKGCDLDIDINDYLKIAFNYNEALSILSLSEENFLESCDYTSIEELNLKSWGISGIDITLKAKYFPIYNHVTVIGKFENGISQLGINFSESVDSNRGTVTFPGEAIDNLGLGECLGFYLFYGVVPSVYLNPEHLTVREEDLLSDDRPISYYGINNREQDGQVAVSEPLLGIVRDVNYSSISTDIFVPEYYKNVFLEPSAPLNINGNVYGNGNRMYLDNSGVNKIEVSAPDHLLDLIQPATFIDSDTIQLQGKMVGGSAAVYGLFDYQGINRLSMMASFASSDSPIANDLSLDAVGYGVGEYSAGGFSNGSLSNYNSTVTYNVPNNTIFNSYNPNMSVSVVPERDGYEFVLPAWTTRLSILVQEIGIHTTTAFSDWKFVGPDVVVLDKNKVDPKRTYSIQFKAVASPIIPNISLNNNTIDVIIDSDLYSTYPIFRGLYVLGSRTIDVRLGYINPLGGISYFKNKIQVELIVTKEYLRQTITGLKSIIF